MNTHPTKILMASSLFAATFFVCPLRTWAGQACGTQSGGPYVCVKFGAGTPQVDTDFRFDFNDPDNPDVEFITGAADWEVWSQVSSSNSTPDDLGDLTLDPSSDYEDFDIKIANGAGYGAANVLSMNFDGTINQPGWEGYSAIKSGSKISGDLTGDLVLVADSGGNGGSLSAS